MTALITGATGFLGAALTGRLLADGKRVRILVRSLNKAESLIAAGADAVVGDVTDPAAVRAALEGVTVVYHLAGKLLIPGVPAGEYQRTNLEGTRVVVVACQDHPGLERLVHCSTTGVLGETGAQPADENAAMRPTNVYEASKAEAELVVRQAMRRGLPAVIVRPGLVYGPGDLHLLGFFRSILRHQFRPIGRRPVWLHPIYVGDLLDGLVQCGEKAAALGECFHIAGPERVTLEALAGEIARAEGTALPTGRIPLAAARTLALIGDLLPPKWRRSAPLTRSRLDFLTHSRIYASERAERLLGFRAAIDLRTGLARTVDWYREHGYLANAAAA